MMKPGLLISISFALALALGLSLVWLNIERVDLAYELRSLKTRRAELVVLNDKLRTERDHLTSPNTLRRLAAKHGLGPARPGQLRRLDGTARPGGALR